MSFYQVFFVSNADGFLKECPEKRRYEDIPRSSRQRKVVSVARGTNHPAG